MTDMRKNIIWGLAVLATLLAAFGCKKNSDVTSLPSLSGLNISTVPSYLGIGETLVFNAKVSDITTSDGTNAGNIGIYWQVNSSSRDTLTKDITTGVPPFVFTPDTLGQYTAYCHAFAVKGGYYNSTVSITFRVIDPETALIGLKEDMSVILDDGTAYPAFTAGGDTWMGKNLYGTDSGLFYEGSQITESVFGRYYTWEEAQTACPFGWHLPTAEEFDADLGFIAGDLMADAKFLGNDVWDYWPDVPITNAFGANAIPVGYLDFTYSRTIMQGVDEFACWWTASETDDDLGIFRYIYEENPLVQEGKGDKNTLALSVRCVKDDD